MAQKWGNYLWIEAKNVLYSKWTLKTTFASVLLRQVIANLYWIPQFGAAWTEKKQEDKLKRCSTLQILLIIV